MGAGGRGGGGGAEREYCITVLNHLIHLLLILCGRSKYHSLQTSTRLEPIPGLLARSFTDSNPTVYFLAIQHGHLSSLPSLFFVY